MAWLQNCMVIQYIWNNLFLGPHVPLGRTWKKLFSTSYSGVQGPTIKDMWFGNQSFFFFFFPPRMGVINNLWTHFKENSQWIRLSSLEKIKNLSNLYLWQPEISFTQETGRSYPDWFNIKTKVFWMLLLLELSLLSARRNWENEVLTSKWMSGPSKGLMPGGPQCRGWLRGNREKSVGTGAKLGGSDQQGHRKLPCFWVEVKNIPFSFLFFQSRLVNG